MSDPCQGPRRYQPAPDAGLPRGLDALDWVRTYACDSDAARADLARREVVLHTSAVPGPTESRSRVLFLCTGNSCRSQMAEGLLRAKAGRFFEVYSGGLDPKPIHEMTYVVMDEVGIDIRNQEPKGLREFLGRVHFGHLITVCSNAEERCPVFPGVSQRLYWPIADPAAATGTPDERLRAFREARDAIAARLDAWLSDQGLRLDS